MKNAVLLRDFEEIIQINRYETLKGKTFLISGATGLIGSTLIRFLLYLNRMEEREITVYAIVRNEEKAERIFRDWKSEKLHFIVMDLASDTSLPEIKADYIIHAAAITTSKLMITNPVETLMTSVVGTKKMLDFAVQKKAVMVFVSSMEIYGTVETGEKVDESMLGYIDLGNVRSCYPEGKRTCECLCNAYAVQYQAKVVSVRLAQTFGAGILPEENRVFAQFVKSAMEDKPIVLHTFGKSEGNYVYLSDAVRAILLLLEHGKYGEAYNVVNESSHCTIAEMAELVADEIGKEKCAVSFELKDGCGYAADTKLFMSSRKINELGWYARVSLKEAYHRLAHFLLEEQK